MQGRLKSDLSKLCDFLWYDAILDAKTKMNVMKEWKFHGKKFLTKILKNYQKYHKMLNFR